MAHGRSLKGALPTGAVNDPVAVSMNAEGIVVDWSDHAVKLTNFGPDEVLGKSFFDFITLESFDSVARNLQQAAKGSLMTPFQALIYSKAAEACYFNCCVEAGHGLPAGA
mmetsp:Transcript_91430/g.258232  ORF Transcript_91430/g.258232 Transcript_91430/m.258232 type:complete len:110 (+) Transcript_91430:56-385(+)